MEIPVRGPGGLGDPQRTRVAQSGQARGSTTGPRRPLRPRLYEFSMGIGSGIPPHPLHGFTDPSGGGSRRALVATRGHPRQSGAYLGRPVGLGRSGAHPPVWEAPRAAASTASRGASAGGPEVRASTRSYLCPTYSTFRQGPRLQVMAKAPSPRFKLLRVCRILRDKAPPRYPLVLGEVPAPL
ncbi:hypothetical protein NDU88_002264 [Pleurodeles waltl]|uniref:Uncharacterized protein n=1 Tax=Pleurodeles waltl TaxID=8319 RepID=A0AAV7KUV8_PLEWA|nr:hypothetical protein NDU88_002264 [Pleurodeles waltl]